MTAPRKPLRGHGPGGPGARGEARAPGAAGGAAKIDGPLAYELKVEGLGDVHVS